MTAIVNESWWDLSADPSAGWTPSAYGTEFSPANANPAASSWSDILKFGFGRAVDYGIARMQLQNTHAPSQLQPYQVSQQQAAVGGSSMMMLLVVGAIVFLVASK